MDAYTAFLDAYLADILAVCAILFCGLVVCGLISIPFFLFRRDYRAHRWLSANGASAQGVVVALYIKRRTLRGDENTPSLYLSTPYARYSFLASDGGTYYGDFPQARRDPCPLQAAVEVCYHPSRPQESVTPQQLAEDRRINRLFLSMLAGFGVFTLLLALFQALT